MVVKQYTRKIHDAGRMDKVQVLASSTSGTITNYGVTILESSGTYTAMDAPRVGLRKSIAGTGSIDVAGITIDGSTSAFATGGGAELVGTSTANWAVIAKF